MPLKRTEERDQEVVMGQGEFGLVHIGSGLI